MHTYLLFFSEIIILRYKELGKKKIFFKIQILFECQHNRKTVNKSFAQLPSSYGLGWTASWRYLNKSWPNEWINHKGDWRTSLATLGLWTTCIDILASHYFKNYFQVFPMSVVKLWQLEVEWNIPEFLFQRIIKGTAHYARLLLALAEGFGRGLFALLAKKWLYWIIWNVFFSIKIWFEPNTF